VEGKEFLGAHSQELKAWLKDKNVVLDGNAALKRGSLRLGRRSSR